jgi:hypothetical protein
MPIAEVTVTVWICNLCGRTVTSGQPSLLAAQEFIDVLRWVQLDTDTVVCDRCRHTPEVVDALLQQQKAHVV